MVRIEFDDMSGATLIVRDTVSGSHGSIEITVQQAGAIMHLLVAGDEGIEELYARFELEAVMNKLCGMKDSTFYMPELRPIP